MTTEPLRALRYSKDHCWAKHDGEHTITIGITDFTQSALGAIVFAQVPEVGISVDTDGVLGEVESTKAVSEVYAPVGGTVILSNTELVESPGQLNTDPYGAGWICTIEAADLTAFDGLLDADAYAALIDVEPEPEE